MQMFAPCLLLIMHTEPLSLAKLKEGEPDPYVWVDKSFQPSLFSHSAIKEARQRPRLIWCAFPEAEQRDAGERTFRPDI